MPNSSEAGAAGRADPDAAPTRATRGRGRSRKLDAAIAEATLRLLGEVGPEQLTIEAVARAAGCSKVSIYRRHPTKESLILDVTKSVFGGEPSSTGDVLLAIARKRAESIASPAAVVVVTTLINQMALGTELGLRYRGEVFGQIRERRAQLLAEAAVGGSLRPDVDIELLLDLVTGGLLFRRAHHPEVEPDLPDRLVALLMDGARNRTS